MSEIDDIYGDVDAGFRYMPDTTYQDRAHAYMRRRGLMRDGELTAVQVTVRDLVRRAYEAGRRESVLLDAEPKAMELARIAGEIFKMATDLKEVCDVEQDG